VPVARLGDFNMEKYNHKKIEQKWQKYWEEHGTYKDYSKKDKFYVLDMFPYPSGAGLHVGHPKGYIATDVIARMKQMQGYSVIHPMGWDAFGLPAENYAIANKLHPAKSVEENIKVFKKQLQQIGFTYDWEREINTTDPQYYKWTQWAFLQMFKKGLAYESNEPINWCPSCKTGLANEDLEEGKCERCGSEIEQKPIRQWILKITEYADRLLGDLDKEKLDWPESIKEMQRNWIGRSEGTDVDFVIARPSLSRAKQSTDDNSINVFTTRPDTLFGATFMVLAPEHPLVEKITTKDNKKQVADYQAQAKKKTDLEREILRQAQDDNKEKTGVFTGAYAINPVNQKEIPIWIADYVMMSYGTGAIMAVPAHDQRDYEFAKKYDLEIIEVVKGGDISEQAYVDNGEMINSGKFDGMSVEKCITEITKWLEQEKLGKSAVNYKLQDWVFSRQRYWGEPIPLIHCEKCGVVPVADADLPVELPEVENYEPTGTGESPLAVIDEWVNVKCPKCGGAGKRETNTMPQWAGSSWYYLRYLDNKNDAVLVDKEIEKQWLPVDLYVGGAEHATRHLIYARFWHKFLYDINAVSTNEPFQRLLSVGLINAEDGRKMGKRWNNTIDPKDVIEEFGADSLRLYEMFMGPFTQNIVWKTDGVRGVRRFLAKVWVLQTKLADVETFQQAEGRQNFAFLLNKTIKKVSSDIPKFHFNTAIAAMMTLVNEMTAAEKVAKEEFKILVKMLAPLAPHLAEELWSGLGKKSSVFLEEWPKFDAKKIVDKTIEIVVQINGKVREKLEVDADISEEEITKVALASEKVKKYTNGKQVVKTFYVPKKIVSVVVR